MISKLFLPIFLFGAGSACASTAPKQQIRSLGQAVIVERSAVPPFSGYLATYVQFKMEASGSVLELFYPYFEDGKRLPEIGELCDLAYHTGPVDGHAGDKIVKAKDANVIDTLDCKKSM